MRLLILLLSIAALSGGTADGKEPEAIRFPAATVVVPPPDVSPDSIPKLTPDSLYVVDADQEYLAFASPAGIANLAKETGPVVIRGKFIDGGGRNETRKFPGPFVYIVEPMKTGRVELIFVPVGATSIDAAIRKTIDVYTQAPQPPPPDIDPKPDVDPKPDIDPTPIPEPVNKVLILYESSANNTREQLNTLSSTQIRQWAKSAGVELRVFDKDVPVRESQDWKDAVSTTLAQNPPIPSITVFRGKVGKNTPLPATEAATLEYLKSQKVVAP